MVRSTLGFAVSIAHQALPSFYASLPKELGIDQVDEANIDAALSLMQKCVAAAVEGGIGRLEVSPTQLLELEGALQRDLEHFLRQELELALPLAPRRFEVSFGSERAPAELRDGLDLGDFKLRARSIELMSIRSVRAGSSRTTNSELLIPRRKSSRSSACRCRFTSSRFGISSVSSHLAASIGASQGSERPAESFERRRRMTGFPGFRPATTSTTRSSGIRLSARASSRPRRWPECEVVGSSTIRVQASVRIGVISGRCVG